MKIENLRWCGAVALCAMALKLAAQTPISPAQTAPRPLQTAGSALVPAAQALPAASPALAQPTIEPASHAVQVLQSFRADDVKFDLGDLMEILRDRRHEGWVLAAYPDPKTAQPLIGAGVSLDLPAREHPQTDPLNPHDFIEPSSAELWQAAGLDPRRLDLILADFNHRLGAWSKRGFRRKIAALSPQITDEEAEQLLRVSAIQAVYNAKGYCRDFDRLTASQQMALSQLVYQMGVNLAEFSQFLDLINHYAESLAVNNTAAVVAGPVVAGPIVAGAAQLARAAFATEADYWKAVQKSLVESQWARLYRMRAVSVIAMLDPTYVSGPGVAEQRVGAMLRPAVARRRGGAHRVSVAHARRGPALRSAKMRRQKKRNV
jgi:hypothetical protein